MNLVVLDGAALSEPEYRTLPGGSRVARFVMAVGTSSEHEPGGSTLIMIKAWNSQADEAAKKVHKGSPLRVEGSLKLSAYTTPVEITAYPTYVVARRLTYY